MVPAAQSQSVLICEGCEIVRMRRIHHETNQSATLFSWPENAHSWQFGETLSGIVSEVRVVFENYWPSDLLDIINRCRQPDRTGDIRCAGFKSDRKSTRLNSSHLVISYAVFCLKKKKKQ